MKSVFLSAAANAAGVAIIFSGIAGNLILDGGIAVDAGEFLVSALAMALHTLFLLSVLASVPQVREAFPYWDRYAASTEGSEAARRLRGLHMAVAAPGALICLLFVGLGESVPIRAALSAYLVAVAIATYGTLKLPKSVPAGALRSRGRYRKYAVSARAMFVTAIACALLGALAGVVSDASSGGIFPRGDGESGVMIAVTLIGYAAYLLLVWSVVRRHAGSFSFPVLFANTLPPILVSAYGILAGFDAPILATFVVVWVFGAWLLVRRTCLLSS